MTKNYILAKASKLVFAPMLIFFMMAAFPQNGFSQIVGIKGVKGASGTVSQALLQLKHTPTLNARGKSANQNVISSLLQVKNGMVVIDAAASDDVQTCLNDLESLGLKNGSTYGHMVSGQFPVDAIDKLATLKSIKFVRPSLALTQAGSVTSQGDLSMKSDLARARFGVDGTGVTIGTLSDTYDALGGAASGVASGDLPSGVVVLADLPGGSDEGRGMMELIHDVAPGAKQAFHTAFNGQADFASGIMELATVAGADIIVDDVFYFAEPMFQDGVIAQAVDAVNAMGVSYFSSAGNQARNGYESTYTDAGGYHDFDPGAGTDIVQGITLASGITYFILQWDEPFFSVSGAPGSASDIDIYLTYPDGTPTGIQSVDFNIGADPVEIIGVINYGPPTALGLMINKYSGPAPGKMKYIVLNNNTMIDEFPTGSGTVFGHSNAAGAEAVGAARYDATPAFGVTPPGIEYFSSAGSTPILFDIAGNRLASPELRAKPEIVAPDGGNTTFFGSDYEPDGFPNFFGTSAAAPHAAAVAALMLETNNSLTPTDIYSGLETTAIDMDDPFTAGFDAGFDFGTGFGLIQADKALIAATPHSPFVLLADEDVRVYGFRESLGDIHANDDITFYKGIRGTLSGNLTAGDDITINKRNVIDGDASAADKIKNKGAITGSITDHASVALRPLPSLSFSAGGSDETVPFRGSKTLQPGSYDDVRVRSKGTLNLSRGTYFMDELYLDPGSKLVIDVTAGPVKINVVEKLKFGWATRVQIVGGSSKIVTFNSIQSKTLDIGFGSHVQGNIIAPRAKVVLGVFSDFSGAICAKDIYVYHGATFRYHSTAGPLLANIAGNDAPNSEIGELESDLPSKFALEQNYPNPFNPTTHIRFALPEAATVSLIIYNSSGQVVRTLLSNNMAAGSHNVQWDATNEAGAKVAGGMYFYRIIAGKHVQLRKMVLIK